MDERKLSDNKNKEMIIIERSKGVDEEPTERDKLQSQLGFGDRIKEKSEGD